MDEPVWYLVSQQDPDPKGPVSLREAEKLVQNKESDFHGWKEGMDDWKPVDQIDEFKKVFEQASIQAESELVAQKVTQQLLAESGQPTITSNLSHGPKPPKKELTEEEMKLKEERRLKKKRYQANKKAKWFDSRVN